MSATTSMLPITVQDILKARQVVSRYLAPTPVLKPDLLREQLGFEVGVVHGDDLPHDRHVRELDVVEDAAAEEGVR